MKKLFLRFGLLLILTNCSTYVEEAINKEFKPITPTIAEMKATKAPVIGNESINNLKFKKSIKMILYKRIYVQKVLVVHTGE